MEEIGVCKLCFEVFDEKIRPQCLPCGHSFCTSCVNHIIENDQLTCPTCKQTHRAVNGNDFPINYDLEECLSNPKKTEAYVVSQGLLKSKSKIMQILINEQKNTTANFLHVSEELQSQMKEYDNFLLDKMTKHEEVLLKIKELANRNEVIIKQIDNERKRLMEMHKKVDGIRKEVKDKLPWLNNASRTNSAIVDHNELDQSFAALEEWNGSCQQQLPNAKIILSSKKVLKETMAAISLVDGLSDEDILEIPDLSNTNFTILEKIAKIYEIKAVTIESIQKMSYPLMNLMGKGRIYAIQSVKGSVRSARLSLKEDDEMYLHCLQEGEPPADTYTIKHDELLNLVDMDSTEVFLDLSWEGSIKGRVHILLATATPYSRQFRMLCTGDLGPSYAHSKFLSVHNKGDTIAEYVVAGDYENNNGSGGASIIEGIEKNDDLYIGPYVEGVLQTDDDIDSKTCNAQFRIMTGKGNPNETQTDVFGLVQDGLDIIKAAVKVNDIKRVAIKDCGVVIPL